MGEHKGHSDKAPSYPELNERGSAASRAGQSAGNQQSAGNKQDAGKQLQHHQEQGNKQDAGQQHSAGKQRQNQQRGGQHASGGTPALDDLNAGLDSRHQGPLGNAPQQMDQQSDWNGELGKNR